MAIYADKDKNGVLNGRWRVELQRGKERYRKRWDSHADAVRDEAAVKASWETGEAPPAPGKAEGAPEVHTLDSVIPLARGNLWDGADTEELCYQRMDIMAKMLGPRTRLDAIDTHMVDGLIKSLRKAGKADGTINRYMSHLHTFLLWARSRKYRTLPVDGEDGISFAWKKETQGRIRWLSLEEEAALGDFLTSQKNPNAHAVWKVIQVALATGCRRDEILSTETAQINGDRLHLWETKTDTPRTIPMAPHTRELLVELVQTRTMPSKRLLRTWWEAARKHMGLASDRDFVFHACRHTCATRMVDADVNVFVIKEWMGHKVMETTLRYAHVKPQNLTVALQKVGDHMSAMSSKASNSGVSGSPHTSPSGGVKAPIDIAA